ncbi:F0F1 ATP synthase subunit delta [uncultured Prevotella sp.]|uniref:F0F1 ATP synthase subunit delta n=1 Tax=uncultured Prevotella sp. TaxID=159272 RepID=UPI0026217BB7|nr:F0F1 ATP synthase subunit delta [uncultured Prevotella sp.]
MDLGLISVRYARALLKASLEAKLEEKVYVEMQTLSESYIKVPDFRFTIDNPMFSKKRKKELFNVAFGGSPCKLTQIFIDLVLKEDRENMMQFIANSYITLYRKNKNLIRAKLMTATAVSPSTEQRLRQLVESKTNGIVEFETEVRPEILGGFIIEYDTYRMDVSVKSQLNSILSQLK